MTEAPLHVMTYRKHRLEIFEGGPGWAVRIDAQPEWALAPAILATGRLDGLEALIAEAQGLIDDASPFDPLFAGGPD